jgi:hypothetical protein
MTAVSADRAAASRPGRLWGHDSSAIVAIMAAWLRP